MAQLRGAAGPAQIWWKVCCSKEQEDTGGEFYGESLYAKLDKLKPGMVLITKVEKPTLQVYL